MKIITSPSCILLVSDVRLHEESKRSYFLALTLASARGWMFIHMNTRLCIINSEIWTELGCASSFVWLLKVEAKGLRSTAWESSLHLIPQLLRIHPYILCWCRVWSGRRTFMWLFDSNSPKSSNRKQIPDRYCSLYFQIVWITSLLQLNLLPPTESWMVPHHHLSPWVGKFIAEHLSVSGNPSAHPVLPSHAGPSPHQHRDRCLISIAQHKHSQSSRKMATAMWQIHLSWFEFVC